MNKVAISYKGKHFIIADEDRLDEMDCVDPYVDIEKVISNDSFLYSHIQDCNYYGIPSYIGSDKKLSKKIQKFKKELDETE